MPARPRAFRVSEGDAPRRLDLFLAEALRLSRAQARRLLARGAVCVDGRPVALAAKGERLAPGATVEVAPFVRPEQQRPVPEPDAPLVVLARGVGWIAVDKPAGTPVHPLVDGEAGTLLGALVARHPEAQDVGEGGLRSGVAHRLDVDTSGVVLFATREEMWQRLRAAFRQRQVEKVYRAVVLGGPQAEGAAEVGLVVARHRPARVRVVDASEAAGSRAVRTGSLCWRVLEVFGPAALIEIRPATGFLHQIRATFAHLGCPVVGDRVYGAADDPTGAPRQMLHAARIAWDEVAAASPDPADFAALCERLRAGAR